MCFCMKLIRVSYFKTNSVAKTPFFDHSWPVLLYQLTGFMKSKTIFKVTSECHSYFTVWLFYFLLIRRDEIPRTCDSGIALRHRFQEISTREISTTYIIINLTQPWVQNMLTLSIFCGFVTFSLFFSQQIASGIVMLRGSYTWTVHPCSL